MGEVSIFLFDHLSGAALVLILGYAADQLSTPALKTYIADLIKLRTYGPSLTGGSNFFLQFINGFIEPIFGTKQFSFRFFFRSCDVSLIFLIIALVLQLIFCGQKTFDQFRLVEYSAYVSAIIFVFIALSNMLIDYISNSKSISLLRMAANSGRPSSVFIIAMADTTLTISIFSAMFPFVIATGLLIEERFRPPVTIEIKRSGASPSCH